jgi:hypothetical protein
MKLLIITAVKEYSDQAAALVKKAGIHIFSATDIVGFKDGSQHNLLDDWFGAGEARTNSMLLFSFAGDDQAKKALELVQEYNQSLADDFPLRAFIVPVDSFSH